MDPNAHYQLVGDATQQKSEMAAQTKKVPSASASFELEISRSTVQTRPLLEAKDCAVAFAISCVSSDNSF